MSQAEPAKDLLERCRSGDQEAAEELHRRYALRLLALAEKKIGGRLKRRVGAEDVVQSAFRTFFRRTEGGEFSIDHSGSLWRLLVRITLRKILRKAEFHCSGPRDVRKEVYVHADEPGPEAIASDPTPQEAACLVDELEVLLAKFEEPDPEIVRLCLERYSSSEISDKVGCSRWRVRRVLDRVGHHLRRRLEADSET